MSIAPYYGMVPLSVVRLRSPGQTAVTTDAEGGTEVELLPAVLNLSIYAGDDLTMRFTFTDPEGAPVDMTGTWAAHVRATADAPDPPLAEFDIDDIDADVGVLVAQLDGQATRPLVGITAVWDLQQALDDGTVRTTHRGSIDVTEDVTRP